MKKMMFVGLVAAMVLTGVGSNTAVKCSGGDCEIRVTANASRGYSPDTITPSQYDTITQEVAASAIDYVVEQSCSDTCAAQGCGSTQWENPSYMSIYDTDDITTSYTPFENVHIARAEGFCYCQSGGEMSSGAKVKAAPAPVPSVLAPIQSFFKRLFGKRIGG